MGLGFVLPLAIPSFVLAYVYTFLLDRGGPVEQTWQWLTGSDAHIPSPYSFTGALVVMTLNTFPYVYLLARAAFQNFNLSFEEAAQATGATRWETFYRVSLPLIRPALVASMFLVVLYVVSDFGAVSLLRFQTFTYAIYQQITGRFDYQSAALLSLLISQLRPVVFIRRTMVPQTKPVLSDVRPSSNRNAKTVFNGPWACHQPLLLRDFFRSVWRASCLADPMDADRLVRMVKSVHLLEPISVIVSSFLPPRQSPWHWELPSPISLLAFLPSFTSPVCKEPILAMCFQDLSPP